MLRIYHSPKEVTTFKRLTTARRAFTKLAMKSEPIALVRENGLVYEITFSHASDMVHKIYGNFRQVTAFLDNAFPGNRSLPTGPRKGSF